MRFLPLLLLLLAPASFAEELTVTLPEGDEIPVHRFRGGPDRVLWIPSEYGLQSDAQRQIAAAMAAEQGLDVWLADLHGAWFLIPGRSSYTQVEPAALAELLEKARAGARRLYVLSTGRGAALTLMALRQWRLARPEAPPLGGAVLLHPNLSAENPRPGRPASYLPIAEATNLPVYIIQPLNSAKRWHLAELSNRLQRGGSSVYIQILPETSDGFHARPDATRQELEARRRLPSLIRNALDALDRHNREPRPVASLPDGNGWRIGALETGLQPYPGEPMAPASRFLKPGGAPLSLEAYRGKVVLLNFWATWCPPCVEEIPSLGRLQQRLRQQGLVVLGVDVGEPPETVARFLEKVSAEYPVLLDPGGDAVGPWAIRAFPTTFVIDRQGRIRYSYFGALEWDDEQVVRLVESLL